MLRIAAHALLLVASLATFVAVTQSRDPELEEKEAEAREYINKLDNEAAARNNKVALAEWAATSNISPETEARKLETELELALLERKAWEETKMFPSNFQNFTLKRMFEKFLRIGTAALPENQFREFNKLLWDMQSNFVTAKVCDFNDSAKCDLSLDPGITQLFATSTNPDELKHYWLGWHKVAGAAVRPFFPQYVHLNNEAAKLHNFTSVAEMWQSEYEVPDFEALLEKLWADVKPLYEQLHAYVRKRLRDKYGDDVVSATGPIPSHLLGNMWAQSWSNIEPFTQPYPDKKEEDITEKMRQQNYTPLKMFKMADEFFTSLNLTAMPESFWNNSIIEKPADKEMDCHPSAWDFYDGEDFRIKQCTIVDYEYFQTTHHEMGHIQYFLQYRHQPFVFRDGANPGFSEAVGDTIALSVSSPKHLREVGLLEEVSEDEQTEINQLYRMALDKIAFLPFAYVLDKWRYGVFRGTTPPEDYNCHYWQLREQLQGVEPPANRTEEDFDAAAKYHISANVEYARYFISFIIQFQFHRSLCQHAGEYHPNDTTKKLVDCDIYRSVVAGNAFSEMLKLGSSKPWRDAMEALTGEREMKADGLLEYFKPLYEWLKNENARTGEHIGWEPSNITYCTVEQKAALDGQKAVLDEHKEQKEEKES